MIDDNDVKFEFPLQWLPQQSRTEKPERSLFGNNTIFRAGKELMLEVKRLGAKNCIITSNQSIRGLERWGGSEFLDGLFTGFKALPENTIINGIRYFNDFNNKDDAKKEFNRLVKDNHPDRGGDTDIFIEIKRQYDMLEN